MAAIKTQAVTGALWGIAFALFLALRIVATAGLMPAMSHGQVTLIACPDAGDSAPLAIGEIHQHHHGHATHQHATCPYAAASSLSFVGGDFAPLLVLVIAAFAYLSASAIFAPKIKRQRLRPPLRGPPVPA